MVRRHRSLHLVDRQGRRELHGADGVVVNDLDAVEVVEGPFQVIVCEDCGGEGCKQGDWYIARRFGEAVAWVPHQDELQPEPAAQVFVGGAVATLLASVRGHAAHPLGPLSLRDAALLLRAAAPGQALGREGEPVRLRDGLLLAVDGAELDEVTRALALAQADGRPCPHAPATARPVDLYLDLPGTPVWTPLARGPDGSLWWLPLGPPPAAGMGS